MIELILHMKRYSIDILCLQETHIVDTDCYEEQGFLVVLSGGGQEKRSWAGVGFIIAPRMTSRIKSYKQVSDRICVLKLKVSGGTLGVITAYAPHNLKTLAERLHFFSGLDRECRLCSANVGRIIFGDLNSRIGARRVADEDVVGRFTFGRAAVHQVEVPNRDLLLEVCLSNALVVANTHVPGAKEDKATFMEAGSTYLGEVTETCYNMLDLLLCDHSTLSRIAVLRTERRAALGTDHFLVKAVVNFDRPLEKERGQTRHRTSALEDAECRERFVHVFFDYVATSPWQSTISNTWEHGKKAMRTVPRSLSTKQCQANHPWISDDTLALVASRMEARSKDDIQQERKLHVLVKKSAKRDRSRWLNSCLDTGDWEAIRNVKVSRQAKCRRLRNCEGDIVESDCWADAMA